MAEEFKDDGETVGSEAEPGEAAVGDTDVRSKQGNGESVNEFESETGTEGEVGRSVDDEAEDASAFYGQHRVRYTRGPDFKALRR